MPTITIEWSDEFNKLYTKKGHPLGKNRKGRKKWIKRFIIQELTKLANESNQ